MAEPKNRLPEFDVLRKRVSQRAESQGQRQDEALKRAFARTGGIGSGSFVKQQQLGLQKQAEQKESALQGVDLAESQQRRADEQTAIDRRFRERQQEFAEGQSEKQFGLQDQQAQRQEQQFEQTQRFRERQFEQANQQFETDKLAQTFNFASQSGKDSQFLRILLKEFQRTGKIPDFDTIDKIQAVSIGRKEDLDRLESTGELEELRRSGAIG